MTKGAPHFSVLSPYEFVEDVVIEAENIKQRLWMQAMDVEPGENINKLLMLLPKKAEMGLDVRLHADYYTLLITDGYFNYLPSLGNLLMKNKKERLKKKKDFFALITQKGGKVVITNPPTLLDKIFPARGRNHMKIVIADNKAWIGGTNFHDDNLKIIDLMVKISDPKIVEEISKVFLLIDKQEPFKDYIVSCTEDTQLIVDSGIIRSSIILDTAVNLINQAEKSVFSLAPLIPDADYLDSLDKARKRNIQIEVIAPEIKRMHGIYSLVDNYNYLLMFLKRKKIPINFKHQMIHAKLLIIDEKKVLFGSHNFSNRGVQMGTEEIAILSENKVLVENLINFFKKISLIT